MTDEMVPGRRYRVTKVWEGKATAPNYLTLDNGVSLRSEMEDSSAVVTVEEIKPTYIEGRLYRDADGDVVLYSPAAEDHGSPWISIAGPNSEPGESWFENTPVEPLVELELKEKQ